jgi:hypothetical protein
MILFRVYVMKFEVCLKLHYINTRQHKALLTHLNLHYINTGQQKNTADIPQTSLRKHGTNTFEVCQELFVLLSCVYVMKFEV